MPTISKLVITQIGGTFVNKVFSPTDSYNIDAFEINIGGLWNDIQFSFACDVQQKNIYQITFEYKYFNEESNATETKIITDYID